MGPAFHQILSAMELEIVLTGQMKTMEIVPLNVQVKKELVYRARNVFPPLSGATVISTVKMEVMKKGVKMLSTVIFHLFSVIKDLTEPNVWKFPSCATVCRIARMAKMKGSSALKSNAAS